jgi:hypothetical protein
LPWSAASPRRHSQRTPRKPAAFYRPGVLIPATHASVEPFFDELRINGFVEGQNLIVTGAYDVAMLLSAVLTIVTSS